jgi:hypothetical protein
MHPSGMTRNGKGILLSFMLMSTSVLLNPAMDSSGNGQRITKSQGMKFDELTVPCSRRKNHCNGRVFSSKTESLALFAWLFRHLVIGTALSFHYWRLSRIPGRFLIDENAG